ncbi:type IV pilus twitching motility protein PilT [Polynucleobacter sp. 80A-SIGWE]|uniref:type IV pilus twitching motility protein PilT n=1 Tax=Polynucleobacter sp. 80A-SIGWE TaxID=2689100 RepID=UPI001C0D1060|nr:type IV pilus twitching motility protein PilT [Polynucleobacter sp. 80A-SIGWE]MBU3589315.1 type IV pilus twitching motility protein PilT [Polynucleobacter sp. 80A-SIGWE]
MEIIDKALHYVANYKLSDLHLHVNEPVAIRVDGEIQTFADDIVTQVDFDAFIKNWLTQEQRIKFMECFDADLAVESGGYRFRVNLFKTSQGLAAVMRKIESEIPSFDSLSLPAVARDVIEQENGLILVTGPTGSGKSTTLAAMIDRINRHRHGHIITIEDPIEFVHRNQKSVISQREVARDTLSFSSALRASLREDPDVILVGELRDLETIQLALTAAETGHLVFGTLHTSGAPNTINRIIDVFPSQQQDQVRAQLSQSLRLVMTQRLLRRKGGVGRVGAFEVMTCNPAVRNLIRENKVFQIPSVMQMARGEGMITMDASLQQLAQTGQIDLI